MLLSTTIDEKVYVIEGIDDAVDTFRAIKVLLDSDRFGIVLPERTAGNGRPAQKLRHSNIGMVFLEGCVDDDILHVSLPLDGFGF